MEPALSSIAFRTRRSQRDSRLTLYTLVKTEETDTDHGLASSTALRQSPVRNLRKSSFVAESQPVQLQSKRSRKSKIDSSDDDLVIPKSSPSPKKSSPTKLRAKLLECHPEPPRWREAYEIASAPRRSPKNLLNVIAT